MKTMKNLTLQAITSACGGQYRGDKTLLTREIAGTVIDSRKIGPDFLYIPMKGERVDGHDFIKSVFAGGALAALSEKELTDCPGPYILVDSTRQALIDLAGFYRRQLTIPIIGITGSVGKTSTKEMIASVLSVRYRVCKTEGNFNNEIGLPLTILSIRDEHEVAVVEMGISDFGEMHVLAGIARPDDCVITNIGTCHLENLGDRDGVLRAKTEVFDHLSGSGTVFLNGDDDKLRTIDAVNGKAPAFFGIEGGKERPLAVSADGIEDLGLAGTKARLLTEAGSVTVTVPIPGRHHLYNAMAAAGIGLAHGMTLSEIRDGIASARTIGGRNNLVTAGGILILDDCYNANPMSMRASLSVLAKAEGRKIAVLGDMGELGTEEESLHRELGCDAARSGIDALFCAGSLSEYLAQGAKKANEMLPVFYYRTRDELLEALLSYIKKGDTVLVKASHFMEYAKIVEALKNR